MKTDIYNKEGQATESVELPARIFNCSWNANLVHQALRAQTANQRKPWAHAKSRGEVRGGGRKPWRQKGTGRARHGSIRSPIWKGGGVTHGPSKERSFALKINKKMRQKAIFAVLSRRLAEGEIKIVDSIEIAEPKTRLLTEGLKGVLPNQNALIIASANNKNLFQAASNLRKVNVIDARSLNVYDLLRSATILIERGALDSINEHYHAVK